MTLESLLTPYFCDKYKLNGKQEADIEYVSANTLITANRLDIIAKYIYVEFHEYNYNMQYPIELYSKHIEAFTEGVNVEKGQEETKNTILKYISVFNELILSIKNGYDATMPVIPVGEDNVILNGSHRVAIAAFLNICVPIVRFKHLSVNYDADFFHRRLLSSDYIDHLVCKYCELKDDCHVAIFWPGANNTNLLIQSRKILSDKLKVVYSKTIPCNYNLLRNLVINAYLAFDWIGSYREGYTGATNRAKNTYVHNGNLRAYIVEGSLDIVKESKAEIRNLFNIGTYSLYATDTKTECIEMVNILFNRNSLHLFGKGIIDKYPTVLEALFGFKKFLLFNNIGMKGIILDSSCIMALYAMRLAHDIDYITESKNCILEENEIYHNHQEHMSYHGITTNELLFVPKYYCYCFGLKFVALSQLLVFKENCGTRKDYSDIDMIKATRPEEKIFASLVFHVYVKMHNANRRVKRFMMLRPSTKMIYDLYRKIRYFYKTRTFKRMVKIFSR